MAPGAAPRRAGHSRQVWDPCLVSKHRLGDDLLVTGQWLREMGGCRRELVVRFSLQMGQYNVMVLEGRKKEIKVDHAGKGAVQQQQDWTGRRPSARTRWPRMKLSVGEFWPLLSHLKIFRNSSPVPGSCPNSPVR